MVDGDYDRTKVAGQTTYPPRVLEQAKDENAVVNMFAAKLFEKFIDAQIVWNIKNDKHPFLNKEFSADSESKDQLEYSQFFNHKETNQVVRLAFTLGENLRQGCELDLQARLDTIGKEWDAMAPSILKPSAENLRSVLLKDQIPGMY